MSTWKRSSGILAAALALMLALMPIGMNAIAEGWFGSGSGGSSGSSSGSGSGGSAPSEESGLFDWGAAAPTQPPAEQAFALQAVVRRCNSYVSLRSDPDSASSQLARVPKNEWVTILSDMTWKSGDGYFVRCSYQGQVGYMLVMYLDASITPDLTCVQTTVPKNAAGKVYIPAPEDDVILREGPGTNYGIVGLLFGGEVAEWLGQSRPDGSGRTWYYVRHMGRESWVSSSYTALTVF